MIPGADKRGVDFTDLMMWLAIASKHVRLMVLLGCMAMVGGLDFYIYARPVYSSKATVSFREVGRPIDTEKIFQERARFKIAGQLTSLSMQKLVEKRMVALWREKEAPKVDPVRLLRADFVSDDTIEITFYTYKKEWVQAYPGGKPSYPEVLVQTFLDNRELERKKYIEDVVRTTEADLFAINRKIKEDFTDFQTAQASTELRDLTLELEQLRDVPRLRLFTRQRIVEMDQLRIKLTDTSLGTLARLALLASIEYDLRVGQEVRGINGETGGNAGDRGRIPVVVTAGMLAPPPQQEVWRELERKLWQLQQELTEGSRIYLPRHPKMITLTRQIEQIHKQLEGELKASLYRFELDYARQQARSKELDEKYVLYENIVKRHDELAGKFAKDKASQPAWAQIAANASAKLKELQFGGDKERLQLRFIEVSQFRDTPIAPNKLKVLLVSLAVGIGLAIGVPFLLEFLDQTATNVEKVEQVLQLRGLGIVPKFDEQLPEAYTLIDPENGAATGNLLESFRAIRTNLMASAAISKPPQVIMVTSTVPKEGKTVVLSNMAMAFAQAGERTLIIDANLRRGLAHQPFRCRSTPGLSNILIDHISVEETIRPTDYENVSLLPCGEQLDGDIEQLGSPAFSKLIDRLRQKYTRILIDAPPVLGIAETCVMQGVVDGVLLVIWANNTPMRNVKTAVDLLHANHANFYGFVLNRLDLQMAMNRFHYYYYSNHYYNRHQALEKVS